MRGALWHVYEPSLLSASSRSRLQYPALLHSSARVHSMLRLALAFLYILMAVFISTSSGERYLGRAWTNPTDE